MAWICYWWDIGFAIHRLQDQVLAGYHYVVALHLCTSVTKQYNFGICQTAFTFCGWEGNCRSGVVLAMCHRYIHLCVHGKGKGNGASYLCSCNGVQHNLPLLDSVI